MHKPKTYADRELVSMIRAEGSGCNEALAYLYQAHREPLGEFLLSKGATSQEEVEDIFQEGIISLVLNIQGDKFQGKSSLKTYLYAIAKQMLFKKQQKKRVGGEQAPLSQEKDWDNAGDHLLLSQEQQQVLEEILGQLSPKCRTSLRMWAMNYSMKEIAKELGYKDEQVARNHKSRCMKKIQTLLEENRELKKLLKELI